MTTDLERYLTAVAVPYEKILEVAEEEGTQGEEGWIPAWAKILNPETCPARFLPYLAMFVGVEVPKVATEAEARALVKEEQGLARGTGVGPRGQKLEPGAIGTAIERVLGEGIPYLIIERTNAKAEEAAYFFLVIVPPGKSTTALKVAIEEKKPGGVMFLIVEREGTWYVGKKKWSEVEAGKKWSAIVEGEY